MGGKLHGAAERKRSSKLPRAPELGQERGGNGGDRTGRSGNSDAQDETIGKAIGADEVWLDMFELAGGGMVMWTTTHCLDFCTRNLMYMGNGQIRRHFGVFSETML